MTYRIMLLVELTKPEEVDEFSGLYEELRANGIHVLYVIEAAQCNTAKDVDTSAIMQKLIDGAFEYRKCINMSVEVAITSENESVLRKYKNSERIVVHGNIDTVISELIEKFGGKYNA